MLDTTNPMFLMGALVAIASAGFFSLRYFRPTASREYDVVFAIVGFIYAVTLMWEGWRLIPLLAFAQLLLIGTSTFFAVESFRLRLQLTERARQSSDGVGPSRRGPRGFTRTYQGENYDSRQVRGSVRNRMRDSYEEDTGPRRRKLRSANGSRPRLASSSESRRTGRRPRPSQPIRDRYDDDISDIDDRYGDGGYPPDKSRQDDYPSSKRPSRSGRSRPAGRSSEEDFSNRDEFARSGSYEPDNSSEIFNNDSFPDEPRITRRPRSRSTTRRRPPRMPDNFAGDSGFDDEDDLDNNPIRPIDADDYGSDYDDGFEDSY